MYVSLQHTERLCVRVCVCLFVAVSHGPVTIAHLDPPSAVTLTNTLGLLFFSMNAVVTKMLRNTQAESVVAKLQ